MGEEAGEWEMGERQEKKIGDRVTDLPRLKKKLGQVGRRKKKIRRPGGRPPPSEKKKLGWRSLEKKKFGPSGRPPPPKKKLTGWAS